MHEYKDDFYEKHRTEVLRSARVVVPLVLKHIQPTSVVDIGCGLGSWLRVFGEYGISDVVGVDSQHMPVKKLEIPVSNFRVADLMAPLNLDRRFDLALCLEVAEHLPEKAAPILIDSLVRSAPLVLFSAAVPHQGGTHHVNEQWPQYWAGKLKEHGYVACDCFRLSLWHHEEVAFYYIQNLLLFANGEALARYPSLRAHVIDGPVPALVHPDNYLNRADPTRISLRWLLGLLPLVVIAALRRLRRGRSLQRF
jgi:SAM-dependent methyltransferase